MLNRNALAGLFVVGCLSVTFISAFPVRADAPPTTQQAVDPKPVNKMCVVDTDEAIDPGITAVYNGKTYGFCCKDCVAKFEKDPAKYAANAK